MSADLKYYIPPSVNFQDVLEVMARLVGDERLGKSEFQNGSNVDLLSNPSQSNTWYWNLNTDSLLQSHHNISPGFLSINLNLASNKDFPIYFSWHYDSCASDSGLLGYKLLSSRAVALQESIAIRLYDIFGGTLLYSDSNDEIKVSKSFKKSEYFKMVYKKQILSDPLALESNEVFYAKQNFLFTLPLLSTKDFERGCEKAAYDIEPDKKDKISSIIETLHQHQLLEQVLIKPTKKTKSVLKL